MASLRDTTERLLSDPRAAEMLKLADSYILQLRRIGRGFILPRDHVELKPVIEYYAKDFTKFVSYVKAVRDAAPPRSERYISLHELYRMLNVRLVQQERRNRIRRALVWLSKNHPKLTQEQRSRWVRKLEQKWGKERLAALDEVRRKTAEGRLSTEEREEVLAEFWAGVDRQIAKGDLPSP